MARSFEEYSRRGGNSRNCPRCGMEKKDGAVTIRLLEFADGNSSRFNQKASRQISMCEGCTIEVYEQLVESLEDEANGGTRPARSPAPRASTPTTTRRRRRTRAA